MSAFMRNAVKNEATGAELAARVAAVRNIPPHEPGATCAAEAYPLERVWPRHLLEMLPWRDLLKVRLRSLCRSFAPVLLPVR